MNKQAVDDFIANSFDKERFIKQLESLNKRPRKGHRCDDCGYYYDEGDIFNFDGDYLCGHCADDRGAIKEEENKLHNKGGL